MVWYGPVQRDPVAEVGVVAVLLSKVFGFVFLSRRQRGRDTAFSPATVALNQAQRFGQTLVRQNRQD